jgi:hypothetical protein
VRPHRAAHASEEDLDKAKFFFDKREIKAEFVVEMPHQSRALRATDVSPQRIGARPGHSQQEGQSHFPADR